MVLIGIYCEVRDKFLFCNCQEALQGEKSIRGTSGKEMVRSHFIGDVESRSGS